jgi:predicted RecB family nuclease
MQDLDGQTVYSATDLVGFLECEHLTELERAALGGLVVRPVRDDPELEILQERGLEHETRFLDWLRQQGRIVTDGRLTPDARDPSRRRERIEADADHTRRLMADGADVIYQATLFDGTWLGYVDFLVRVEEPSELGAHAYEVFDTKLARRTTGGALIQMCVYSELVGQVQGHLPERMHVALGGSGHHVESHRLDEYLAYFRSVRDRFLAAVTDTPPSYPLRGVPDPVAHCDVCRWEAHCAALRRDADHLSQVAGLRTDQARRLGAAGVRTLTALATLPDPPPTVDGISDQALNGLHAQARLQHASRGHEVPRYELLPVQAGLGLAALPEPHPADLFFDIEGDPFAEEDGLEYLFGIWDPMTPEPDGTPGFRAWWAHSREEEKTAFEGFVDFVMDRWRRHPGMHVYHYAAYERGRMGMLSTRHATRETEIDDMLRRGLFVDLFKVVRQGVRVGTPSYSIKKLEPLYALAREIALRDAGSSIVRYEEYIRSVVTGEPNAAILVEIAEYNRDDCRSNQELRDWLEARRDEAAAAMGASVPRPGPPEEPEKAPSPRDARIRDLAERLVARLPVVEERRRADPAQQATWLLANLLEWHRREEKVEWWAFFDRCSRSDAELAEDPEAIGQLTWIGEVDRPRQSVRHRYRFDPEQPYRLKVDDDPVNPATASSAGTIVALDPLRGTLDLQWSRHHERPHPTSLIPHGPIVAEAQKGALERIGEWVAANGMAATGPYRAARAFLLGDGPRAGQLSGTSLVVPTEPVDVAARRIIRSLDETVLPVQGPPGAGKTYIGAEMILELVRSGRRVGITAFTHRALTNLLDEVLAHAHDAGATVRAIRKLEKGEEPDPAWTYATTRSNQDVANDLASGAAQVAAGTTWLWSRHELEDRVDTLFVDEAGQLSLANVIAVSGSARNVVLLGDPQQLSQVKKGAHPDGVDVSALEFALDGGAVIDPTRGLFLPETHRLHPDVNRFTSEVFYERQLHAAPETSRQALQAPGALTATGTRWFAVHHEGNRNSSQEEAALVADLYRNLLLGSWTDQHGEQHRLDPRAVLVVAPYNAQVELLTETLGPIAAERGGTARVGTVDKIQGQQAAVVLYSLATSSQDELPRSMEFLYSLNRLNVATSRGRCMAVVIGSPDLLRVSAHTPFQMRLANALCRFVELAADAPTSEPATPRPLTMPWAAG